MSFKLSHHIVGKTYSLDQETMNDMIRCIEELKAMLLDSEKQRDALKDELEYQKDLVTFSKKDQKNLSDRLVEARGWNEVFKKTLVEISGLESTEQKVSEPPDYSGS